MLTRVQPPPLHDVIGIQGIGDVAEMVVVAAL